MNASTIEPQSKLKSPSSKRRLRVGVDFHSFEGIFQGSRARLLALFPHLFRARWATILIWSCLVGIQKVCALLFRA